MHYHSGQVIILYHSCLKQHLYFVDSQPLHLTVKTSQFPGQNLLNFHDHLSMLWFTGIFQCTVGLRSMCLILVVGLEIL